LVVVCCVIDDADGADNIDDGDPLYEAGFKILFSVDTTFLIIDS
jgi:hypothetical protein